MRLRSKMRMDLSQMPNNPLAVRAVAMAHLDADTRGFLRQLSEAQGTSFGADNETTAIGRWTWSILLMAMT